MTVEYLFELRFAELPPRLLRRASRQLSMRLFEDLMGRGLGPREMITGSTPRRLMVCLQGLPEVEPDRQVRELGPAVAEAYEEAGEPTAALSGFVERVGAELDDLQRVKTERGAYLAAFREAPGKPVAAVLAEIVPIVLDELDWWPPMRAGGGVRGMLSLLDGEVLGLELSEQAAVTLGAVVAGASTAGHPVLSPAAFEVVDCADYLRRLRELGIEVIPEARRAALEAELTRRAAELGGELEGSGDLLDRLSAACEIPGVVHGSFDPDYTTMPEEVVLTVLGNRLDAFALRRVGDTLLPFFLTVMDRADDPRSFVKAGQERAASGHLFDARFRYEADRRLTLAERSRRLDGLDFHPRLGSFAAKAERTRELVELACSELDWQDELEPAREASALLKADLTSGMVRDYPSLRGTIGGIYAREEGYVEVVWRAIYQHYRGRTSLRRGADGATAQLRVGRVVAVADRLDSLVGFFGLDQAPSGSKDPFGLRRLARGLLRIIVDGGMELDLDLMVARAVLLYGDVLDRGAEDLLRELQAFLAERFRHFLGQRGFAYDEISAAEAIGVKSLPDLLARITALKAVREEADFRSLVLAAKRIFNIVEDSQEFELRPDELADGAERDLHAALGPVREAVDRAAAERRYEDCLRSMADLVPHLDRFFADVLVMDEDEGLRANRIALLQACRRVFWRIARLKAMAVEKGEPG